MQDYTAAGMGVWQTLLRLGVVVVVAAAPAIASTASKTVILGTPERSGTAGEGQRALVAQLTQAAQTWGTTVIPIASLGRRMRAPQQSLRRCELRSPCLARLARRLRVEGVVVSRTLVARGKRMVEVIHVHNGVELGRGRLELAAVNSPSATAKLTQRLFPDAASPRLLETPELVPPLAALELAPLPDKQANEPSSTSGTPGATPAARPDTAPSGALEKAHPETETATAPPTPTAPVASSEPVPTLELEPPPPASDPSTPWVLYGGLALGGIGVGSLVTGAIFGLDAQDKANRLDADGPKTTPQLDAQRLSQEQQDAANRANTFLIAGSGLMAVGLTLVLLDLWVWDETRESDGVNASLGVQGFVLEW